MKSNVVIVDYGVGNVFSIKKLVERLGYHCVLSKSEKEIASADNIIMPGVGHFGQAMRNLRESGLIDVLNEVALIKKVPILGICLGMQLMCSFSEEGNVNGLGWFQAKVSRLNISDKNLYKVPHISWNTLNVRSSSSSLFVDLNQNNRFYFLHSYCLSSIDSQYLIASSFYENEIVAAIQRDNIVGVQFHPEKSHLAGEVFFKNFLLM